MPLIIPNEILCEIFWNLYFETDNYLIPSQKDLFNCLLVNRKWCSTAITVLWAEPMTVDKDKNMVQIYVKVIKTFLLFIDVQDKQQLIDYGLRYANTNSKDSREFKKYLQILDGSKNYSTSQFTHVTNDSYTFQTSHTLLFDYPLFLRYLDLDRLLLEIIHLISPTRSRQSGDILIFQAILKMLVKHCKNLLSLVINNQMEDSLTQFDDMFIVLNPEVIPLIHPIKETFITINFPINKIFLTLSCFAKVWFEYIDIATIQQFNQQETDSCGIASLIISQTSLRTLVLRRSSRGSFQFLDQILCSLPSQSGSLTELTFSFIDFSACSPLHSIAGCKNLRKLRLWRCYNISDQICEPLVNCEFKKLFIIDLEETHNEILMEWKKKIWTNNKLG
ncbi:23091_t:CDS:2 [Gigaspora margarita]|uniref:23091_t:CDS:1 n=1 Tax=Gigaspora margarita TaxID=4874 RepID=A0ABM8VVI2_GIGMA|nr:23091_t:CDS:2 [Gigaspora margarita]